ncbi:type II toxin-antitoxin system RelE/ParE family toxin [Pseudomonas fluorescens]
MKGFGGNAVLEIVEDFDGSTYRGVYTVRFGAAVYVLHCFQKKSTKGIATTQHDLQLTKQRLKAAQDHAQASQGD